MHQENPPDAEVEGWLKTLGIESLCQWDVLVFFHGHQIGLSNYMPDFAISSIVDNLILMSFVELGNSLRRAITVAKARGSEHEFVTHEYTIGPGGISLLPIEKGKALPVLPFQSYYGLLSRAPTRLSPDSSGSGQGGALPKAT